MKLAVALVVTMMDIALPVEVVGTLVAVVEVVVWS